MDASVSNPSTTHGTALRSDQPDGNAAPEGETTSADTEYQYGPPTAVERETNYISDNDLLAWLAQRQDGMYGELRDLMDMSRERSKVIEDLAHFKAMADGGVELPELAAEAARLLTAYAGTEYEERLRAIVGFMDMPLIDLTSVDAFDSFVGPTKERLSADLEGMMDALTRDDQLALIDIQSLTSDIREASQLVSNLMSSSSQAANTIVGNLRA